MTHREIPWKTIERNKVISKKKIYSKINIISDDTKLIVFRFNKGIYRLIGLKSVESNIFNILAIDWDFSLYNHGR